MPKRYCSTRTHSNMHGYRGVEWNQRKGKFIARIGHSNKGHGIYLGQFNSAEDAAKEYDYSARRIYGEEAYLNFPSVNEKQTVLSRIKNGYCPEGHDLSIFGRVNTRGESYCKECNRLSQQRRRAKNGTKTDVNPRGLDKPGVKR